jgi:hypothetical protein
MTSHDVLIEEIIKQKTQLSDLYLQHYTRYEIFSWVWWLLVALMIIPFIAWWKQADKKRLPEICLFGMFIALCATLLDVIGSELALWEYEVRIFPEIPLIIPVNFIILPVTGMILYQNFSNWGRFVLAAAIASTAQSFVAEPLAVWIGQYRLIHWEYVYSLPIYLLIYISAKFLVERVKKIQASPGNKKERPLRKR